MVNDLVKKVYDFQFTNNKLDYIIIGEVISKRNCLPDLYVSLAYLKEIACLICMSVWLILTATQVLMGSIIDRGSNHQFSAIVSVYVFF